jgi:dienelactone hydrolase
MAMYYIGFCAGAQLTLKSAKKDMLFLKQVLNEAKNLEVN